MVRVMQDFVALDVETANQNLASICAVGAVRYHNGLEVGRLYNLIDPFDRFHWRNTRIHKIEVDHIEEQPLFPELLPELEDFIAGALVVHHSSFDKTAIRRAAQRWELPEPDWAWRDTVQLAKRAWPGLENYKLPTVCRYIGHPLYHHHNALEDALAAGQIYLKAYNKVGEPPRPQHQLGLWREHDQRFASQHVVLGSGVDLNLSSPRIQARLERMGARIGYRLTDRTTILVIADQADGSERVTDQQKRAAERIKKRQHLRVMSASKFLSMLGAMV